jgi:uncharacterized protein YjbJ (UPF0337 family)
MNWDQIKGNWKTVSDKIRVTWGKKSAVAKKEHQGPTHHFYTKTVLAEV